MNVALIESVINSNLQVIFKYKKMSFVVFSPFKQFKSIMKNKKCFTPFVPFPSLMKNILDRH